MGIVHILEDDRAVCDALALLIEQYGHRVEAHHDAESFFSVGPPAPDATVFVDLGLPGLRGADVIRWLNGLEAPPRIIVITGESQASLDSHLRGLGVSSVLRKPLSEAAIAAAL